MSDKHGSSSDDGKLPEVPEIPDDAKEDHPLASSGSADDTERVDDSDARHKRKMDLSKLKFAIIFASATTSGAVGLAVIEYLSPGYSAKGSGSLSSAGDALKLLATTSLGYIFGRTMSERTD